MTQPSNENPANEPPTADTGEVRDYAQPSNPRGGKIGAMWANATGQQRLVVVIVLAALLASLAVGLFGGRKDERPAPMQPYAPPTAPATVNPDSGATSQPAEGDEQRTSDRENPADTAERDEAPEGVPQGNSDDARVTRATYVLDTIVTDPDMSLAEFDSISQRLQDDAGLTPDSTIRDTYQMLEYLSGSNEFASRASEPSITDNGDRTYKVTYEVAGGVVPKQRNANDTALRYRIGQEMESALSADVSVPVTFTINLNEGTVSTDTARWW